MTGLKTHWLLHVEDLTAEDRALCKKVCTEATPGPWYAIDDDDDLCMTFVGVATSPAAGIGGEPLGNSDIVCATLQQSHVKIACRSEKWDEDAEFIAAARTLLPKYARELELREMRLHRAKLLFQSAMDLIDWGKKHPVSVEMAMPQFDMLKKELERE